MPNPRGLRYSDADWDLLGLWATWLTRTTGQKITRVDVIHRLLTRASPPTADHPDADRLRDGWRKAQAA